jgi:hypothetical protein
VSSVVGVTLAGAEHALGTTVESLADALRTVRFLRGRAAFVPRDDDVYVVTYPRSGTTWVQFIIYLLRSDRSMAFEHLSEVSPWWERSLALGSRRAEDFEPLASPRVFKSHLPRRWLPDRGRYVYVARDGLDVAVSYYNLYRSHLGFRGDFEAFFERFVRGEVQYRSWFKHVEGWRRFADDPRVLFMTYEGLRSDLRGHVGRIATFLGLRLEPANLDAVERMASFEFMKAHEPKFDPITETLIDQGLRPGRFIREGKSGSGRAAVTPSMRARFEAARRSRWPRPDLEARLPDFLH